MLTVSPGCSVGAALGMKTAASLGLPAERIRAKKGSQPMGDLRVLERVSSSAQSRLATKARSLGRVLACVGGARVEEGRGGEDNGKGGRRTESTKLSSLGL